MIEQAFQRIEESFSQYRCYSITKLVCILVVLGLAFSILVSEFITLFSFDYIGLIESAISSQISIFTFTYQGLELNPKTGNWVSVERNTMFEDARHVYKPIWLIVSVALIYLIKFSFIKDSFKRESLKTSLIQLKEVYAKTTIFIKSRIIKPILEQYKREFLQQPVKNKVEDLRASNQQSALADNPITEFKVLDKEGNERIEVDCPYCAERILKNARKCKHCGSDINTNRTEPGSTPSPIQNKPTKTRSGELSCPKCNGIAKGSRGFFVWFFVVILFPVGLLLLLIWKPIYKCKGCGFAFK